MSYASAFYFGYIKKKNIKEFSHRDILMETTTNCPYSVLKGIKRLLDLDDKFLIETKLEDNHTKIFTIKDKTENE